MKLFHSVTPVGTLPRRKIRHVHMHWIAMVSKTSSPTHGLNRSVTRLNWVKLLCAHQHPCTGCVHNLHTTGGKVLLGIEHAVPPAIANRLSVWMLSVNAPPHGRTPPPKKKKGLIPIPTTFLLDCHLLLYLRWLVGGGAHSSQPEETVYKSAPQTSVFKW